MRMMGNFGGTFWANFRGFQSSSQIDEILEKEDTTLAEVMDQDEILQEMRNQNQKLIDFLNRDRIMELIEYITVFPPEDADNKRGHKFPFLASELFGCEILSLLDKFYADQSLLEKLFSFFVEPLNLTLAGYVSKLVISLFIRNPPELLKFIIEKSWNSWFLQHMEYRSVADIVTRIILVESNSEPFYVPQRKEIVQNLIKNLASSNPNAAMNSSQILCELICKPTDVNSWAELAGVVTQKESLNLLTEGLISQNTYNINAVVTVLRAIMTSSSHTDLLTLSKKQATNLDEDASTLLEDEESPEFIESFVKVLPKLKEILENPNAGVFSTTFNEDIEVLGEGKIKIIEVILAAIKMEIKEIQAKIEEIDVVSVIVGIFFKFEWNSILHATFEQFFSAILTSSSQILKEQILKTSGLLTNIVEKGLNPSRPGTRNPSLRPGYMGHITRISNLIVKTSENHLEIAEILSKIERWDEFKSSYLENTNFIENRHLGGYQPLSFGDNFGDEDIRNTEDSSKNPFSSYSNNENSNEDLEIPEEEIDTSNDKPLTTEDLMFDLNEDERKIEENNEPDPEKEQKSENPVEVQEPNVYSEVNYWAPPIVTEGLEDL